MVEKINLNLKSIGHLKLTSTSFFPNTAPSEVSAKCMETYMLTLT